MPEEYEDSKVYEQIWQNIDNVERDINDFKNKDQERKDFTWYFNDLQKIYSKIKALEADISWIIDESVRKILEERLNKLKTITKWIIPSIDNFVNWKTNDPNTNAMVWHVYESFSNEVGDLVQSLNLWRWIVGEILLDSSKITESNVIEVAKFLGMPYWEISIEWQKYLWCILPSWKTYAIVNWKLVMCEIVLDEKKWWRAQEPQNSKQDEHLNKRISISSSEKLTQASKDNPTQLQKKETAKFSYDLWKWFSWNVLLDTQWSWVTPRVRASWKWLKTEWWSSQISASYSPWSITWAESWWWKNKAWYKLIMQQNFKLTKNLNFSISGIYKTSDISKFKTSNFCWEMKCSYKIKSNISISTIANIDYSWKPTFVWGSINIAVKT